MKDRGLATASASSEVYLGAVPLQELPPRLIRQSVRNVCERSPVERVVHTPVLELLVRSRVHHEAHIRFDGDIDVVEQAVNVGAQQLSSTIRTGLGYCFVGQELGRLAREMPVALPD